MEIRIDFDKYETTVQNDLVSILKSLSKQSLHDYIWKNGALLSRITKIDRDTDPVIIAGKHGYDHRSNQMLSNQIGTTELSNRQSIKLNTMQAKMNRYNTNISMTLTYEAANQRFVKSITSEELRNACIYSIERAILYGTPSTKGLINTVPIYKKNWSSGAKAPAGSGAYFSSQGIYTMFYDYNENGYDTKNATFFCGTKAYNQLMIYRISGGINQSIISSPNSDQANILGVPIFPLKCLDPDIIAFGDFRTVFLRMLDLSEETFKLSSTGGIKVNYNSAFESGFVDEKAFFIMKIISTDHDKTA